MRCILAIFIIVMFIGCYQSSRIDWQDSAIQEESSWIDWQDSAIQEESSKAYLYIQTFREFVGKWCDCDFLRFTDLCQRGFDNAFECDLDIMEEQSERRKRELDKALECRIIALGSIVECLDNIADCDANSLWECTRDSLIYESTNCDAFPPWVDEETAECIVENTDFFSSD